MLISDMQDKDVVDIKTGEMVGNIVDIEIDVKTGNIKNIITYYKKGFFSSIKNDSYKISWNNIKKIGEDVILIDKNI